MEFVLGLLFQRKLSFKKPPLAPSIQCFFSSPVYPPNSVLKCWLCKCIALGLKALWMPTSQTFPKAFSLLLVLLQQDPKALCSRITSDVSSEHSSECPRPPLTGHQVLPWFYWHIFHVLLHCLVSTLWKQSFKNAHAGGERCWFSVEQQQSKRGKKTFKQQNCRIVTQM